jgi:hypothetical protein
MAGIAFNLILIRVADPDPGDNLPLHRMDDPTSTEPLASREMVDVAVMTVEDAEPLPHNIMTDQENSAGSRSGRAQGLLCDDHQVFRT